MICKNTINHIVIEALKRLQTKYNMSNFCPNITRKIRPTKTIELFDSCIMREGVPFSLKITEDTIRAENDEKVDCWFSMV